MATTPLKRPRYRISSTTTATNLPPLPPPPQSTYMDDDTEDDDFDQKNYNLNPIPNPSIWFTKLLSFQSEMTYNFLSSLLSPFSSLPSVTTESYHQVTETKDGVESSVAIAPAAVANGGGVLLKKIGLGLLGALYVCMVLTMVMVVAIILGVGLVKMWVEEPVFVREKLHFDYTNAHPEATLSFGGGCGGVGGGGGGREGCYLKRNMGVPVGHTFFVSLVLLLPESNYNRDLGVFQLSADLISTRGDVIARSSQPCMLKFRSFPIRLMRTFFMGIPLLLGLTGETQTIAVPMLKHKEGYPRTESIRISLIPRAGTSFVPQIYESDIIMNSQLPWRKEIVYSWKWTFYVWTSLYMYIILLIVLGCYFKRLLLPSIERESTTVEEAKEAEGTSREEREVAESLRRWRRNRNRRKAVMSRGGAVSEKVASSAAASSITVTREEAAPATDEDAGDSESSVCFGGEQESLI